MVTPREIHLLFNRTNLFLCLSDSRGKKTIYFRDAGWVPSGTSSVINSIMGGT